MSDKKILTTTSIAIIMISLIAILFAFNTFAYALENNQETSVEFITDTDTYANLNHPQLVAANDSAIISVNENIITNVTENTSSSLTLDTEYKIIDIALDNDAIYLLAMKQNTNLYKLYICGYNLLLVDSITISTSNSSLTTTNIIDIFNTHDTAYFVSGQTVFSITTDLTQSTITATAIEYLTNINTLTNIKIFDNIYYTYFHNLQGVFQFNENSFEKKFSVNTDNYTVYNNSIYYLENNALVKRSSSDEITATIQLNFTPTNLYLNNETLLLTAPEENRIYIFDLNSDKITDYYGDYGKESNRLNTPKDIATFNRRVYIADSLNNRIIDYSISENIFNEIDLNHSPILITASNNLVAYVAKENNTYNVYLSDTQSPIYSTPTQIINIESKDNFIYALTADGNILAIDEKGNADTIIQSTPNGNIKSIEIPEHSAYLYYRTENYLYKYNIQTAVSNLVSGISVANSFTVDYNGNVFEYDNKTILNNDTQVAELNNFGINADDVISYKLCNNTGNFYAITKNHRLFTVASANIGSKSFDNDRYDAPTDFDIIKLGTFKEDSTEIIGYLDSPNNIENTRIISNSEWFILLAEVSENATEYYYVCNKNGSQFLYVEKKHFNDLSDYLATDYYIATLSDNVNIYHYPFESSTVCATLKNNTQILSVHILTNNADWNWHYVSYSENGTQKFGYIKANDVSKVSTTSSEFMNFYKVKADKIGHKVKIYAKPSLDSEVLFAKVNDGEEIQAYSIDTESEFTKVFYNDTYGYILSKNLIKSTMLTPNQILAICISVGSVLAIVVIIIIAIYIKKHKKINVKLLDDNI